MFCLTADKLELGGGRCTLGKRKNKKFSRWLHYFEIAPMTEVVASEHLLKGLLYQTYENNFTSKLNHFMLIGRLRIQETPRLNKKMRLSLRTLTRHTTRSVRPASRGVKGQASCPVRSHILVCQGSYSQRSAKVSQKDHGVSLKEAVQIKGEVHSISPQS